MLEMEGTVSGSSPLVGFVTSNVGTSGLALTVVIKPFRSNIEIQECMHSYAKIVSRPMSKCFL
jgi:hypothetical protein